MLCCSLDLLLRRIPLEDPLEARGLVESIVLTSLATCLAVVSVPLTFSSVVESCTVFHFTSTSSP